jgi:hypothetical protein
MPSTPVKNVLLRRSTCAVPIRPNGPVSVSGRRNADLRRLHGKDAKTRNEQITAGQPSISDQE